MPLRKPTTAWIARQASPSLVNSVSDSTQVLSCLTTSRFFQSQISQTKVQNGCPMAVEPMKLPTLITLALTEAPESLSSLCLSLESSPRTLQLRRLSKSSLSSLATQLS